MITGVFRVLVCSRAAKKLGAGFLTLVHTLQRTLLTSL